MANLRLVDGAGATKYNKGTGAGSDADPFVPEGYNPTVGALTDAAVSTDADGSLSAKIRGLVKILAERFPSALGAHGGLPIEGVASGTPVPVSGTFYQTTQPVDSPFSLTSGETYFSITTSGSAIDTTSGSALAANTSRLLIYPTVHSAVSLTTTSGSTGLFIPASTFVEMRITAGESNTLHGRTLQSAGTIYVSECKS